MRTAFLLAAVLATLAGCAGDADVGAQGSSVGQAADASESFEYETPWVGADVVWAGDSLTGGRGAWSGTMIHYVPKEAEENRTLLYNVTFQGGGASFHVTRDDVEIASVSLALGDTRLEVPAAEKARYSYFFAGEPAGVGSIHVGVAQRGRAAFEGGETSSAGSFEFTAAPAVLVDG